MKTIKYTTETKTQKSGNKINADTVIKANGKIIYKEKSQISFK